MSLKFDDVRVSVCLCVCVCVCLSRSDRNWTCFDTSFGVLRVVNMQKILFSHTFLKKKHYLFCNLFWSSFFYHLFCNLFLYRTHHLQDHPEKWPKHVFQSCVCMYTTPETIETFSENARCLDNASSAEIILLIQRVCITFFRISTQKALRATLLRGCFLVKRGLRFWDLGVFGIFPCYYQRNDQNATGGPPTHLNHWNRQKQAELNKFFEDIELPVWL